MGLLTDSKGNVAQIFTGKPSVGSTFSSPGTYTVPVGTLAILIQPSADVTVQLNGTGPVMTYESGVKDTIGIHRADLLDSTDVSTTTIVFANTATVPIWVM